MPGDDREEPVYVMDETEKNATPMGMLSRTKVNAEAPKAAVAKEGRDRTMLIAGLLFGAVLILGIVGIFFNGTKGSIAEIDARAKAEAAKKPVVPEQVQGVRVRKGFQQSGEAPPPKTAIPLEPVEEPPSLPPNTVPDGSAPAEATPAPAPAPAP